MSKENRNATLLALSTSDVYVIDPYKSSRILYTRNFLLSLAKAKADSHRTLKLSREIQFAMSSVFNDSFDFLPSPYSEDTVCHQVYASKVPVNVYLLHKSNQPHLLPCCNKALPSSNGDSNGSLKSDISGSSECTNQKVQAELDKRSPTKFAKSDGLSESYGYFEPPLFHDVQLQQDSEFKSSNTSLEDCSSSIYGFTFPDEDSLITYDGPFSTLEVKFPPSIDGFVSFPESNLIEDDLDSPDSTFEMIKSLIESVLDGNDDYDDDYYNRDYDDDYYNRDYIDDYYNRDYVDDYYNRDYDNSSMDGIMEERVQHGARAAKSNLSYQPFHSNQLNLERDPLFLSSCSCPCGKIHHGDHELIRFGFGSDKSVFQQGLMRSLEVPSWKEKTNQMQNCFGYQDPGYDCSVKGVPNSLGDGDGIFNQAIVDSFKGRKLEASQFMGGFY